MLETTYGDGDQVGVESDDELTARALLAQKIAKLHADAADVIGYWPHDLSDNIRVGLDVRDQDGKLLSICKTRKEGDITEVTARIGAMISAFPRSFDFNDSLGGHTITVLEDVDVTPQIVEKALQHLEPTTRVELAETVYVQACRMFEEYLDPAAYPNTSVLLERRLRDAYRHIRGPAHG